ncbi:SRPBCC family protein [Porphyrobacter sp. SLTP]|uniref:SRPBCC family protein n=1 Tax=Porphyrobacter sp. SLTP TaxID=2683266 RepID=UPI00256FB879|nr:SRPBCC family protein [Porphyrobacter sp. SLTP]
MKLHFGAPMALLGLASMAWGAAASAEVTRATDDSFVSRHEVVVKASPKQVWLALISPATWWTSEHTWSGSAKNLTLVPQAGGCFCETIPEVDEPGRFTLEGSVEHMRVVQAYPESALRMVGNLGPLQSEPVTGVLTIAISKVDKGTRIVWEYNVGGPMRYEVPVISKAVDGVMGVQLAALAKPLVVVAMPSSSAAKPAAGPPAAAPAPPVAKPAIDPAAKPATLPAPKPAAATPAPATAPKPVAAPAAKPAAPKPEPKPAPKSPSVADVFGDLADEPPR